MNDLIKKPYEISLWDEETVYVITTSTEDKRYEVTELPSTKHTVLNQYTRENKIALIGSNKLNIPIRAFDAKLTRQVTGANTLTFQIYSKYYDEDYEEYRTNPFINLLVNERKVKLYYDYEWLEFNIKEIQEKSDGNIFTYTCKDSYINELGKSGYDLEFETDLQNNQGTIIELGEQILDGTDWRIDKENSDLIQQKNKEALCAIRLDRQITAICMNDFTYGDDEWKKGDLITIQKGKTIQLFYSSYSGKEKTAQFLFRDTEEVGGGYVLSDEGFILNSPNWEFTPYESFYDIEPTAIATSFGEKLISKHLSKYLTEIDKYCNFYTKDGKGYYGFTETEYSSIAEIQNLLTNSANFISTNGWTTENDAIILLSSVAINSKRYPSLQVKFTKSDSKIVNGGLYDNRAMINGFARGDQYIFAIRKNGGEITGAYIEAKKAGQETQKLTFIKTTDLKKPISLEDEELLEEYEFFEATSNISIPYNKFLEYDTNFYVTGTGTVELIDAKLFKKITDEDGRIIVPDLQETTNSIIKTKYYFFPRDLIDNVSPRKIFSIKDIEFSDTCYEDEEVYNTYIPEYSKDYEKIRSITGSKSNRFNLIQELCETFECWAKFSIDHNEKGAVSYEYVPVKVGSFTEGHTYYKKIANNLNNYEDINFKITNEQSDNLYEKIYHKKVTFKQFIGQDNPVGFRYGINLKSIQRTINSDQIVSKMIVEPNTNKYAANGSCSIQTSTLNPTGENTVYNFEYYIRHNLLSRKVLQDDLYGFNGGIGLYKYLREWNDEAAPLINESIPISAALNTLTSRQLTYKTIVEESEVLYKEAINEIMTSTKLSEAKAKELKEDGKDINGQDLNEYTKDYIRKRDSAKTSKDNYETMYINTTSLVNQYNEKLADINDRLNQITAKKKALNADFYKKYSRYIQEGSWSSADYIDPELYYLDSQKVSFTSAFPKITYSINVLEISQVEGFEPYFFRIGDKTYMEDTEFFGWRADGRPYQEEIVVTEVSYSLDDPSKNTIKVQNYKSQFEDLFQRIAAATQSLQYHEGEYKRAAHVVDSNGIINASILQNSMNNNNLVLKNAKQESVYWDETGITLSNFLNSNNIVRLVSGGILLTNDGGKSWTTGITGDGINANVVTTGRLDTERIRIFNSSHQTFEWNSDGINAYFIGTNDVPEYDKFVRFNQYGLFGYMGPDKIAFDNIDTIKEKANFSLTWQGLNINLPQGQEGAVINVNDKFKVDGKGNVTIDSGSISFESIEGAVGDKFDSIDQSISGINGSIDGINNSITGINNSITDIDKKFSNNIKDANDNLQKLADGKYTGTFINQNSIVSPAISGGAISGAIILGGKIGIGGDDDDPSKRNFYVDEAGNLYANTGTFKGTISGANLDGNLNASTNGATITGAALKIGLQSDGSYAFEVNEKGEMTATKGSFSGSLSGATGTFNGSIQVGNPDANGVRPFIVSEDGNLNIGRGNFVVTPEGNLTANDGKFNGSIIDSKVVGVLTPGEGGLIRGVAISAGGTEKDPAFYVSSDGVVTAKKGRFEGSLQIGLDETTGNYAFKVDEEGNLYAGKLEDQSYAFTVSKDGNLIANKGTFRGALDGASGTFKGDISAATGTFSGAISIGKQNNEPVFMVNSNGHLIAKSGEFYGELKSATGSFAGSLNIGDKFIVDSNGNVTLNGNITWGTHTGTADELYQDFIKDTDTDTWPDYCYSSYIDSTQIYSPTIRGNDIEVQGFFKTYDPVNKVYTGYMGAATGKYGNGETTYGVALSTSGNDIDYDTASDPYIIVTNAGARLFGGSKGKTRAEIYTAIDNTSGVLVSQMKTGSSVVSAVEDRVYIGFGGNAGLTFNSEGLSFSGSGKIDFSNMDITGFNIVFG